MQKFQLFTDSCSDLGTSVRKKYGIEYCRMNIVLDGEEKPADLDFQLYSYEEFYGWMLAGRKIKTTQVPVTEFVAQFRPLSYTLLVVANYLVPSMSLNSLKNNC